MKVLKDASQVLRILMEKKFQLCKKFNEAEELEASRISGQERSIGCVRGHIRYVMSDHREFDEVDMAANMFITSHFYLSTGRICVCHGSSSILFSISCRAHAAPSA